MVIDSDRDLIRRSERAPALFGAIFDRHATAVHRYLRRRVGEQLASELTAEVFTRAFAHRRRFDGRAQTALPWLLGIATNLVKMNRRSEERRLRAYARAATQETEPSELIESDERIDASALGAALAQALSRLPAGQRDVLLLHAWAGLSHDQIAAALGLTPGAVRTRLHRARETVSAQLTESRDAPLTEPRSKA